MYNYVYKREVSFVVKNIKIVFNDSNIQFVTEEWMAKGNSSAKLIDELEMSDLIKWLEQENTLSKRVNCKNYSDLILFKNSIKYVTIQK